MSKYLKLLFVGGFIFSLATFVSAQDSNLVSIEDVTEDSDTLHTVAANLPTSGPKEGLEPIEMLNPRADDIFWQKVVYRTIDLREKMNYPLYFPEEATDNRLSLFTLMFRLIQENKIKVYEYLDAREVFTDQYVLPFKKLLDNYDILHQVTMDPITNDTIYEVDESDIPNRDVIKYYVKEVWYFDKMTSTFDVKIIALCPIMVREDPDMPGSIQKFPLFWIPFETFRKFLSQTEVLVSERNNGARPSFDDIFIKRRFSSYIFKESNIKNRNLLEYNNTVEDVKREQDRIKTSLVNFESDLWEY